MPWAPELFSAPALARYEERHRHAAESVPYFEGLMMGEVEALVGSFTGSPELHDPVRVGSGDPGPSRRSHLRPDCG